ETIAFACVGNEVRQFGRPPPHVLLVERAFGEPPKKARHALLQHLSPRREQRCAGRHRAAKRHEIVFVAAGTMQQQDGRHAGRGGRLEPVNEIRGHHAASSAGSTFSISPRRGSRKGGSLSAPPSEATGSSTAKPGMSVAISNSTCPGSRK